MRNNVINEKIVPQYVNLREGFYGFSVSITFNIDRFTFEWVNKKKSNPCWFKGITAYSDVKNGRVHYHITCVREYNDLNMKYKACYVQAPKDKNTLKILMRQAEIARLNQEINEINGI